MLAEAARRELRTTSAIPALPFPVGGGSPGVP